MGVLRKLGIAIDVTGDGVDSIREFNQQLDESRKSGNEFVDGVNKIEKEMADYAKSIGLTGNQLVKLNELHRQNTVDAGFAKKFGFSAGDVRRVRTETEQLTGVWQQASGALGALASVGAGSFFARMAKQAYQAGAEFEKTNIAFETMLGSAELGKQAFDTLENFSIVTPFEPGPVIAAGRQLLAFGKEAGKEFEDLEQTMRDIGNVSAGTGKPLTHLTTIYGQVMTKGKLQGDEILQLAEAGIPIVKELATMMGKSESEIYKLSSAGKISFGDFERAFAQMSAEGGKFEGLMDKLSQSAGGMLSSINGFIGILQRSWGVAMLEMSKPFLKVLLPLLKRLAKFFESDQGIAIIKIVMPPLIALVGTVLAAAAFKSAVAMGVLKLVTWGAVKALATLVWPIVATVAALTALYLIAEDVWYFARGGGSATEHFLKKLGFEPETIETIRGAMATFFDGVSTGFGWLVDLFGMIPWKVLLKGLLVLGAIAMWPFTLMVGGIVLAIRYWDELTGAVKWAYDLIIGGAGRVGQAVMGAFVGLLQRIGSIITGAGDFLLELGTGLISRLFPFAGVFDFWDGLPALVQSGMRQILNLARRYGKQVIMFLFPISALYFYWDEIEAFFRSLPERILSALEQSGTDLKKWFSEQLPGIIQLVQTVQGVAPTAPAIEARATGGPVTAGNPYLIGEEGREVMVPAHDGYVIPNHQLTTRRSGSSVRKKSMVWNINQSFHLSGSATETDQRAVESATRRAIAGLFRDAKTAFGLDDQDAEVFA